LAQAFQLGTATNLWKHPSVVGLIDAKENGFKYVEVDMPHVPVQELIPFFHSLKEKIDSSGLQVWSVHLPYSHDITVLDDKERERNVSFMVEVIELTAIFKPFRLVLHPSAKEPDNNREQAITNCIHSIGILSKSAEKIGAQLCVENPGTPTFLGHTPEELLRLVDNYPDVGICFDLNHCQPEVTLDFVKKTGHRIAHLHVSDTDGTFPPRHWIPGQGTIPWGELLYNIRKSGYNGVFMFEATNDRYNIPVTPKRLAESFEMILAEEKVFIRDYIN